MGFLFCYRATEHFSFLFVCLFWLGFFEKDFSVSCSGGIRRLMPLVVKVGVVPSGCGQPRPGLLFTLLQVLILYKALYGSFFPPLVESSFRYCCEVSVDLGICNLEYTAIIFSAFFTSPVFLCVL